MVLGQSAATAAVFAIDKGTSVQEVDVSQIQKSLKENPLADKSTREVLIDNDDKTNVSLKGSWSTQKNAAGCYGQSLLTSAGTSPTANQAVNFNASIEADGPYQVYIYFPRITGGSSRVETSFFDGNKKHTSTLMPNQVRIEGQTSGEWILLGEYDLKKGAKTYVEISTLGSDGIVVADAVMIYPKR